MNILFLGDSLIEYYDWQERFPEQTITNLGIAGESAGGLFSRLVKIKELFASADRIFIMTGINNVAMGDLDFFEFYKMILEKLNAFYPEARIYVHSLLPVLVDFISNDEVRGINSTLETIASDYGAEYVDLYSRFVDTGGRPIQEYLLDDGVHISRIGYDVWARVVEGIIHA